MAAYGPGFKHKIALAMIVKGDDEEARMLKRCLKNISPYVDGIFITSTHLKYEEPNESVARVCDRFGARLSHFEWVNDFAKARNFNFSQVPKDYDYIIWCDADDIFQNPDKIRPIIDENLTVDGFAFWYYYDVDSENNPTIIHKKTQIIRNDGCTEWTGRLHEDFKENRALNIKFVEGIQRIHLTTPDHSKIAQIRNVEISKEEAEINPDDPRVYFNLANSYFGASRMKEAKVAYEKFLKTTQSDDERYIALQRLSVVERVLGNRDESIDYLVQAIGLFPEIPDAYNQLGILYFDYGMLDKAERYLLLALPIKPPYHKMIVFNPRDYDYTPMMTLAKVYFNKSRPDYALPLLKNCLKFYPNDESLKVLIKDMEVELANLERIIEVVKRLESYGNDKDRIKKEIDSMPIEMQSHPAVCRLRNAHFIKEKSSGKDIAYYCGETSFDWNPDLFKTKGFGGSEEAVVNLAKEWATAGYNVTVFNSCGLSVMERDGVTYKPFWHFNPKDRYDYTILWRSPRLADHELNTGKLFIDMHDVISPGEFNEKRLKRIDRIFVKTEAHRDLFPKVPDEKFAIIPNGMDFGLFKQDIKKDPYLLVNTSSPDRSLDSLPELFKEVKKQVPQARLKWAYGWDNWDKSFSNDKVRLEWKEKIVKQMEEAGVEVMGRLSQKECAKLYLEGRILAYPTEFYEIDCISVKKAQACQCLPITSDFAAMKESNVFGVMIKSSKTIEDWCKPYQFSFGIQDFVMKKEWVDAVVAELKKPYVPSLAMELWTHKFDWPVVAGQWSSIFDEIN